MSTECNMGHHIVNEDDVIIASFRLARDRNLALRALRKEYPEFTFEKLDE